MEEKKTFYVRRPVSFDVIMAVQAESEDQALHLASMTTAHMTYPSETSKRKEMVVWVAENDQSSYKDFYGQGNIKVLWSDWTEQGDCCIDPEFVDESETEAEKEEREVQEIVDILLDSGWRRD